MKIFKKNRKELLADLIIDRLKKEFGTGGYSVDIENTGEYIVFHYIKTNDSCSRWNTIRVSINL